MTEEVLGLLGLGVRAGTVTIGTTGVRAGLQRGEIALVVVAKDATERTRDKVVRVAQGRGVRTIVGLTAEALGQRLGRSTIQALGVRDRHLAAGVSGSSITEGLGGDSGEHADP